MEYRSKSRPYLTSGTWPLMNLSVFPNVWACATILHSATRDISGQEILRIRLCFLMRSSRAFRYVSRQFKGLRTRSPPSTVLLESILPVLAASGFSPTTVPVASCPVLPLDLACPSFVGALLPPPLTSAPKTVVARPRRDHPECMLSSGWKLTPTSSWLNVPSAFTGCNKTECPAAVSSEICPH